MLPAKLTTATAPAAAANGPSAAPQLARQTTTAMTAANSRNSPAVAIASAIPSSFMPSSLPQSGGVKRSSASAPAAQLTRTGKPFSSAKDRSCRRANRRPRPASGIKMPAHTPSAPGVLQAACAHCQRRGHARHSAFAPSSTVVVQRSGSRVHGPFHPSSSAIGLTDLLNSRRATAVEGCLWSALSRPSLSWISTIQLYGRHHTTVLSNLWS
jgi:hypothetical protein